MLVGLAVAAVSVSIIAGETIFEMNCADTTAVQSANISNSTNKPNERASGKILKPFADNSSWCNVWTEYDIIAENGVSFQRINVTKIEKKNENDNISCGQIVARMNTTLEGNATFKLKIKARSSTSSKIKPMIRVRPEPYTQLWRTTIALSTEWKDYEFDFETQTDNEQPVSFYIQIPEVGIVDIAEFKLEKK